MVRVRVRVRVQVRVMVRVRVRPYVQQQSLSTELDKLEVLDLLKIVYDGIDEWISVRQTCYFLRLKKY